MSLVKKICYTIECDAASHDSLCNKLEDYIGALDGLTTSPSIAEDLAKKQGFVQISPRKWICPECAKKLHRS